MSKYHTGKRFLDYEPIYDKEHNSIEMRLRATGRYVLKFAAYKFVGTYDNGASTFNVVQDGAVPDIRFMPHKNQAAEVSLFDI